MLRRNTLWWHIEVDEKCVVGFGTKAVMALVNPGDSMLVEKPVYA